MDVAETQQGEYAFSLDAPGCGPFWVESYYYPGDVLTYCWQFVEWAETENGDWDYTTTEDNLSIPAFWHYVVKTEVVPYCDDPDDPFWTVTDQRISDKIIKANGDEEEE